MMLVKLGGSVITDKSSLRTFRKAACGRLAKELRPAKKELIVVHGAGSFGHIIAKKHSLHRGFRSEDQLGPMASVQRDVRELNLAVLGCLIDNGLNAVSVPPAAMATFHDGNVRKFSPGLCTSLLNLGLVPVTFGDIVPDSGLGFSICSGDLMMEQLAKEYRPKLVVFVADVDGIFDADPKRSGRARLIGSLDSSAVAAIARSEAVNADVTGSIHGKLERMLAIARHCEKCMIVNGNVPGRLEKALMGEKVLSTVIVP